VTLLAGGGVSQLRIQGELVDALVSCQALRTEQSRQMLADLMSDAFGEVISLSTRAQREQSLELVRHCCKKSFGLHTLVEAVLVLDRKAPEISLLRELGDEWEAMKAFPIEEWDSLRDALQLIHLTNDKRQEFRQLRGIVRMATGGRSELPLHCVSAWDAFLYVAGANTAAKALPPAMIFLDCVAERTDDLDIVARLREWNRQWADKFALVDLLDEAPWRATRDSGTESDSVYLVIQIDPDPNNSDLFMISHWRHWNAQAWEPRRLADVLAHRRDLQTEVDRLISELEIELGNLDQAYQVGSIFLEFVLPWDMLNTPVEFWRKQSMSDVTVPLAVDHPVVLRSIDRMRATRHRLAWKRRWRSLAGKSPANRHYWSQPSGSGYFTRLAADLESDQQIVSLVLSEPPGDQNAAAWREVAMAFRAGIPAIIWDREDCTVGRFREAVTTLLADGAVAELPQRVAQLRREALREDSDNHPGRTIVILFDDPDRLPEPPSTWWNSQRNVVNDI